MVRHGLDLVWNGLGLARVVLGSQTYIFKVFGPILYHPRRAKKWDNFSICIRLETDNFETRVGLRWVGFGLGWFGVGWGCLELFEGGL